MLAEPRRMAQAWSRGRGYPQKGDRLGGVSLFWDFAHQSQWIAVGVSELSQPQFSRGSAVDDMGARPKLDAAFHQRPVYRVDIGYLEVNRRSALARLIRR